MEGRPQGSAVRPRTPTPVSSIPTNAVTGEPSVDHAHARGGTVVAMAGEEEAGIDTALGAMSKARLGPSGAVGMVLGDHDETEKQEVCDNERKGLFSECMKTFAPHLGDSLAVSHHFFVSYLCG